MQNPSEFSVHASVRSGWRTGILELRLQQMRDVQKARARQSAGQGIGELGIAPVERLLSGRFSKLETRIALAAASQISVLWSNRS